jgi:CRISPR-associated endonuclease/helicase Cas3
MSYPVGADKAARETDLLTMLGANAITLEERRRSGKPLSRNILLQSFKTANDAFQVIGPTQGVVVPFRESGQKIVADLCAAGDLDKQWSLLRRAQRYTLSLYTSQFRSLMDAGAVYQAGDTGVYCLRSEFYDESFGLRPEAGSLEDLIA